MLAAAEMRCIDRNAAYYGVSILDLMERAGAAVASVAMTDFAATGKTVVVVCGTGNNGGDGLVAARILADQARVSVLLARPRSELATEEAQTNAARLPPSVRVAEVGEGSESLLRSADLIVDALLGIGVRGTVKDPYATLIREMNAAGRPILSVDVPSGFGTTVAVRPAATVAMHDAKEGMNEGTSGQIHVADIGLPREVLELVGPGDFVFYPRPDPDSHKGQNGRLLVVGGGPFTGAPALVAWGAYRIGVDVVHLAVPSPASGVVASFSPNFIVHALGGSALRRADVNEVLEVASGMDAIVVGPGLGNTDETREAVRELVRHASVPLVIDADAIPAVAEDRTVLRERHGVATPHHREFEVLTGDALPAALPDAVDKVRSAARKLGLTLLVKGRVDIISDGTSYRLNRTGNAGMTVGGTGDVLAGVVGGLLAKHTEPFHAARMAAFASGYAGDLAFRDLHFGMVATDVADRVPRVLLDFVAGTMKE